MSKTLPPKIITQRKNNYIDLQNKFFEDNLYNLQKKQPSPNQKNKKRQNLAKKLTLQLPPKIPYDLNTPKKEQMGPRRSILINSPLKRSSKQEIEINQNSIVKSKTLVQNFVRRDSFGHMITKGGKQQIQFEDQKGQKKEKKSKCCCIF